MSREASTLELARAFDEQVARSAVVADHDETRIHIGRPGGWSSRPEATMALACRPDQAAKRNADLRARGITGVEHDPKTGKIIITSPKSAARVLKDYVENSPYNPYTA